MYCASYTVGHTQLTTVCGLWVHLHTMGASLSVYPIVYIKPSLHNRQQVDRYRTAPLAIFSVGALALIQTHCIDYVTLSATVTPSTHQELGIR
jgi:hypothetical protein